MEEEKRFEEEQKVKDNVAAEQKKLEEEQKRIDEMRIEEEKRIVEEQKIEELHRIEEENKIKELTGIEVERKIVEERQFEEQGIIEEESLEEEKIIEDAEKIEKEKRDDELEKERLLEERRRIDEELKIVEERQEIEEKGGIKEKLIGLEKGEEDENRIMKENHEVLVEDIFDTKQEDSLVQEDDVAHKRKIRNETFTLQNPSKIRRVSEGNGTECKNITYTKKVHNDMNITKTIAVPFLTFSDGSTDSQISFNTPIKQSVAESPSPKSFIVGKSSHAATAVAGGPKPAVAQRRKTYVVKTPRNPLVRDSTRRSSLMFTPELLQSAKRPSSICPRAITPREINLMSKYSTHITSKTPCRKSRMRPAVEPSPISILLDWESKHLSPAADRTKPISRMSLTATSRLSGWSDQGLDTTLNSKVSLDLFAETPSKEVEEPAASVYTPCAPRMLAAKGLLGLNLSELLDYSCLSPDDGHNSAPESKAQDSKIKRMSFSQTSTTPDPFNMSSKDLDMDISLDKDSSMDGLLTEDEACQTLSANTADETNETTLKQINQSFACTTSFVDEKANKSAACGMTFVETPSTHSIACGTSFFNVPAKSESVACGTSFFNAPAKSESIACGTSFFNEPAKSESIACGTSFFNEPVQNRTIANDKSVVENTPDKTDFCGMSIVDETIEKLVLCDEIIPKTAIDKSIVCGMSNHNALVQRKPIANDKSVVENNPDTNYFCDETTEKPIFPETAIEKSIVCDMSNHDGLSQKQLIDAGTSAVENDLDKTASCDMSSIDNTTEETVSCDVILPDTAIEKSFVCGMVALNEPTQIQSVASDTSFAENNHPDKAASCDLSLIKNTTEGNVSCAENLPETAIEKSLLCGMTDDNELAQSQSTNSDTSIVQNNAALKAECEPALVSTITKQPGKEREKNSKETAIEKTVICSPNKGSAALTSNKKPIRPKRDDIVKMDVPKFISHNRIMNKKFKATYTIWIRAKSQVAKK